jgi:hypothetical protein
VTPPPTAYTAGRGPIDCVIRNLSDGGAKLEVPSAKGVPTTFDLLTPGRPPQPCRVVWRALREVGVQFTQAG